MFVQTEVTPNPNSLKFLPGKKVSNSGPYEITNKEDVKNELVRNILSINGCLLYTSPSPRDKRQSRMPSSA